MLLCSRLILSVEIKLVYYPLRLVLRVTFFIWVGKISVGVLFVASLKCLP